MLRAVIKTGTVSKLEVQDFKGRWHYLLIRKRRRSALTPIIFLTATSVNEKQISRGYALGAVDYIYKPIIPENLKAKVSVFAALHRNSRELARSKEALRLELEARKQADLAQRESEAMYRKLFSHASDAIVVFDDQSDTVLEVNKAAVELYGYTEADFLRLSSKDLEAKPLGAGAQPEKAHKKTMMRSQIKADGRDFLAEVTSASITLKGKKLTMMLARDVTARQKAADAALIRSREIALRPFRPKGSKFTVF